MRSVRTLVALLLALAVLSLVVYVFNNTRLNVRGSSPSDGSLTFETQFPNLSCRKTFKAAFPFVKLECEPKAPEQPSSALP